MAECKASVRYGTKKASSVKRVLPMFKVEVASVLSRVLSIRSTRG